MIQLVGLCGYARSGKSSVASFLFEKYGFTSVKMAGPLKDMLRALGLTESQIEGEHKETPAKILCGQTPRYAMQTLGTEWGRALIDEDFWVHVWAHRANSILVRGGCVVCDDIRYSNEADKIRKLGGQVWQIRRNGPDQSIAHSSEAMENITFDAVIENKSTLRNLRETAEALLFN